MNKICQNCKYHYIEEISFDYPQSCCNKKEINHTTEQWCTCNDFEYSEEYMKKQLEAYENMRKEVFSEIEYFELQAQHLNDDIYLDEKLIQKLKDILNKVGGSDE